MRLLRLWLVAEVCCASLQSEAFPTFMTKSRTSTTFSKTSLFS